MEARSKTPALLSLALAYFAVQAPASAVVGLSTPISGELEVRPATVGTLVTLFTLVFALAAPLAAAALGRLDRKPTLLIGLGVMLLGGCGSAVAPSFAVLAAARVVEGLGAAVFGPAALVATAAIVPAGQRARALAVVGIGPMAAIVLSAPLAAAVGSLIGWRWTLAGFAALTLIGIALLVALLPSVPAGSALRLRDLAPALRLPGAKPILATTLLVLTAQYVVYGVAGTYLAVRFGASSTLASVTLMIFGIVAMIGNNFWARMYDRFGGGRIITVGLGGVALSLAAAALLPGVAAPGIAVFAFWACFNPLFLAPQQARLVDLLPEHTGALLPLSASSLNLGISLGSLLGSSLLPVVDARVLSALALIPLAAGAATHAASIRYRATQAGDASSEALLVHD